MTCTSCGAQNADGQKFCSHCGAPLTAAAQQTTTPAPGAYVSTGSQGAPVKKKKSKKKIILLVVIALLVLFVIGLSKSVSDSDANRQQDIQQEAASLSVLIDARAYIDESTQQPFTREQVIAKMGEPKQQTENELHYPVEGYQEDMIFTFDSAEGNAPLSEIHYPADWNADILYFENIAILGGMADNDYSLDSGDSSYTLRFDYSSTYDIALLADKGSESMQKINFSVAYIRDLTNVNDSALSTAQPTDHAAFLGTTISIDASYVSEPDSFGGVDYHFVFTNLSDKEIKYLRLDVTPYNAVDDPVSCTITMESKKQCTVTGPIAPGETYGEDRVWNVLWYNSSIAYPVINAIRIEYMDGTTVELTGADIQAISND